MTDLKNIKAFVFDIDGVFTNSGILCDLDGELFRTYNVKDTFAIRMAVMQGYKVGIITGGVSASIPARFRSCGVPLDDVYLGSRAKVEELENFCNKHSLSPEDVMFIGDDLPDIGPLMECGIGLCPADAVEEVKEASDIVSEKNGGCGCVRNAVEMVMRAQGKWNFDAQAYKARF
ncbi:MAG: HAD hydrolase family protein [Bacteroidales bacterium]|nr:HAD hydrolase family protein [Bacteroidales bacterium]